MIICNFAAAGNNVLYKVICCAWRLSTQCHSIICTIHVMESNEGIFSLKYNLLSRSTWFWICYLFYLFLFSALLWWSNGCVYNKKPSKLCWCRPKQSCTWCCGNQLDTQGKCFLPGKTCIDFFFAFLVLFDIYPNHVWLQPSMLAVSKTKNSQGFSWFKSFRSIQTNLLVLLNTDALTCMRSLIYFRCIYPEHLAISTIFLIAILFCCSGWGWTCWEDAFCPPREEVWLWFEAGVHLESTCALLHSLFFFHAD